MPADASIQAQSGSSKIVTAKLNGAQTSRRPMRPSDERANRRIVIPSGLLSQTSFVTFAGLRDALLFAFLSRKLASRKIIKFRVGRRLLRGDPSRALRE